MIYLITILAIALEVGTDYDEFLRKRSINHDRGWLLRFLVCVVLAVIDPLGILFYAGCFTVLFSPIMGFLITGNPLHIGKTSGTDKWLRSKIMSLHPFFAAPMTVFFIRLFIGGLLISGYFWPYVFTDFYYEIFG